MHVRVDVEEHNRFSHVKNRHVEMIEPSRLEAALLVRAKPQPQKAVQMAYGADNLGSDYIVKGSHLVQLALCTDMKMSLLYGRFSAISY